MDVGLDQILHIFDFDLKVYTFKKVWHCENRFGLGLVSSCIEHIKMMTCIHFIHVSSS